MDSNFVCLAQVEVENFLSLIRFFDWSFLLSSLFLLEFTLTLLNPGVLRYQPAISKE